MKFVGNIERYGTKIIVDLPNGNEIKEGRYIIEITDIKDKRSLNQNNYFWKLVREISKAENGTATDEEVHEVYLNLLKMAKIKYDILTLKAEAFKDKALENTESLITK